MPGEHVRTSHFCSPRVTWAIHFLFLNPAPRRWTIKKPKRPTQELWGTELQPYLYLYRYCLCSVYLLFEVLAAAVFQHSLIWPRLASPQTHCGAKDDLKLLTFRPLPPQGLLTSTSHHSWFIHFFFLEQLVIETPRWALCLTPLPNHVYIYITSSNPLSTRERGCHKVSIPIPSSEEDIWSRKRERLRHKGSGS